MACRFALMQENSSQLRKGELPLSELTGLVTEATQVVLLLAASDVVLLRMTTPPMSTAKLKAALPALVEDRLLCDPAECLIATREASGGMRTIAITDRAWLTLLSTTLYQMGARRIAAVPFQSCMPREPGTTSAMVETDDAGIDVCVAANEHEGTGLRLPPDAATQEVLQTLRALEPQAPITLYAAADLVDEYRQAADGRMTVLEEQWPRWVMNTWQGSIDLTSALGAAARPAIDWKQWRWPLALAAAVALVNIAGLQIEWWSMQGEEKDLRVMMLQTFKSAYPQESVIVDPLAQMQQKIAAARNLAGQLANDDLLALSAALGEAWAGAAQARKLPADVPGIASLEYRDRSLLVKWKTPSPIAIGELQPALNARQLSLTQTADAWQIRSIK